MQMEAHGITTQGPHRTVNEDAFCVAPEIGLLAVADGVGGGPAGELASHTAIDALLEFFKSPALAAEPGTDLELMSLAAEQCDVRVRQVGAEHPGCNRMSTTLTACLVRSTSAFFLHIGDSRAYLVRNGAIEQLTNDHVSGSETLASDPADDVDAVKPQRRFLLAALGSLVPSGADVFECEIAPGDIIFLCSDGLSSFVSDGEIAEACNLPVPLADRGNALAALVRERGSRDDVTAVVAALCRPAAEEGG